MSRARVILGKTGEDLACAELERRGYAIIARRYRRRGGEIDIIARESETIVFVEVKAREGRAFGDAAEAVTLFKRRRLTQLAVDYIAGFLNRVTADEAKQYYERYVGPYFSADGHADLDVARQAIAAVAAELGVAEVDAQTVYGQGSS